MEMFEYLQSLGEGAYGQVWLCKIRDTGQKVAMKRFKEAHQDPEVMRLAMREIKLLKASQHHNVVKLMEAFRSRSGRVYVVMEYVERTLTQDLRKYSRGFPPALAKMISWQLLQAVSFLHKRKLIHRDLKPANILISNDNTVKICDFGFARTLHPKEVAEYTTYVVTRWYRPPEVLVNDEYGPKIDMWAIGCLMCEMASGRPMFPGKTSADQLWLTMLTLGALPPRQAHLMAEDPTYDSIKVPNEAQRVPLEQRFPNFSPELMDIVKGCLALDPDKRLSADQALAMPYFEDVPQIKAAIEEATVSGHDFWGTLEASWQLQTLSGSATSAAKGKHNPNKRGLVTLRAKSCSQRSLASSHPLPRPTPQPATVAPTGVQPEMGAHVMGPLPVPQLQLQQHLLHQRQQQQQQQALAQQVQVLQAQQTMLANETPLNAVNLLTQQCGLLQAHQQQPANQHHLHLQHMLSTHHSMPAALPCNSLTGSNAATSSNSILCTPGVAGSQYAQHHRPSTPGSAGSNATHITAPMTPLPIQQMRRAMSNAQLQGTGQLAHHTSSTGYLDCTSMAMMSDCSSLQRAASCTPCGTPDNTNPYLTSFLSSSCRLGGGSENGIRSYRVSETNSSMYGNSTCDWIRGDSMENQPQDSLVGRASRELALPPHCIRGSLMAHKHQAQLCAQSPALQPFAMIGAQEQYQMCGTSPPLQAPAMPSTSQMVPIPCVNSCGMPSSSRRTSQILQLQSGSQPIYPASRLSMIQSATSSPQHRRQTSGGSGGGQPCAAVPSFPEAPTMNVSTGLVNEHDLTASSTGHVLELGRKAIGNAQLPHNGLTLPMHRSSNPGNARSASGTQRLSSPQHSRMQEANQPYIPFSQPNPMSATSHAAHTQQPPIANGVGPIATPQGQDLSSVGAPTKPQVASAFASASVQQVGEVGSSVEHAAVGHSWTSKSTLTAQTVPTLSTAISDIGSKGPEAPSVHSMPVMSTTASSKDPNTQQQCDVQLPRIQQQAAGLVAFEELPVPESSTSRVTDAKAVATLPKVEAAEDAQCAGPAPAEQGQTEEQAETDNHAHSKQPSLFKLMKTRLASLASLKGTSK